MIRISFQFSLGRIQIISCIYNFLVFGGTLQSNKAVPPGITMCLYRECLQGGGGTGFRKGGGGGGSSYQVLQRDIFAHMLTTFFSLFMVPPQKKRGGGGGGADPRPWIRPCLAGRSRSKTVKILHMFRLTHGMSY